MAEPLTVTESMQRMRAAGRRRKGDMGAITKCVNEWRNADGNFDRIKIAYGEKHAHHIRDVAYHHPELLEPDLIPATWYRATGPSVYVPRGARDGAPPPPPDLSAEVAALRDLVADLGRRVAPPRPRRRLLPVRILGGVARRVGAVARAAWSGGA